MRRLAAFVVLIALSARLQAGGGEGHAGGWEHWQAGNEIENLASLQRGARGFMDYCAGCHSLKYLRYSRLATDLAIPEPLLIETLVPRDRKPSDYILTAMPAADSENWFGKAPPDLSLVARSRGPDWIYQFLKTFYADPAKPTGVNNLRFKDTAMPHILAEAEGVKRAVFRTEEKRDAKGKLVPYAVFERFEAGGPGRLSAAEYDGLVRDLVNFLDYAGEPAQAKRRGLGVWVILFLLLFTGIAWMLKHEYWKDVK